MPARPHRLIALLAAIASIPLALVAGEPARPQVAQGAVGPAQASTHTVYLPALTQGWTWKRASLDDPYNPGLGNPGYDATAYSIDVTFSQVPAPPATAYSALTTIWLTVTAPELGELSLDLSDATVGGVEMGDAAVPWYLGPGKLWVTLPRRYTRGDNLSIRVGHTGNAATTRVGTADGLARLGPDSTRAWFPSNHHPSDRAKFGFTVVHPAPSVVVANGTFAGTTEVQGIRTSTFGDQAVGDMAPGDVTVMVAPFQVVERTTPEDIKVRHYLLRAPADADKMLRSFENAVDRMDYLSGYPFDTFGVVETNLNMGIRPVSSLLLLGRAATTQRPVALERSIGNPVARLWFGSAIGVSSSRDDWLNSGLAEYLNLRYAARDQGPELIQARLAAHEWNYSFQVGKDLPLTGLPADGSGASVQTYKAPWAYRMLEQAVGWEDLQVALNGYTVHRQYQTADLAALQHEVETVTGQPQGPLFDRLFRQANTPRANLAWAQSGSILHLRVCQFTTQPVAFDLPLGLHAADTEQVTTVSVPATADAVLDLPATLTVSAVTPDPAQALLADITVVPSAGASPAPCAAMPMPPLPTASASDAADPSDTIGDPGVAGQDDKETVADGLLPEDLTRHDQPVFVPGEPSIGDDYFPSMGNSGYDVSHYTVKMHIDPDAGRIDADATLAISSTLAGLDRLSLDFLRMDGDKGMVVQDVTVNDQPAIYQRPMDADKLWVDLPGPVPVGGSFSLRVRYAGTPTNDSGLSVGSGPMMYAVNEPNGTRGWLPSNDHPRDKATFRFELTVTKPYVAVANGVKVSETETATINTTVFEMRQPMASYLATVAAARYRVAEQRGPGDIPITHYFLNDPADAMRVANITPDVLAVFSRLVGPYAFDTYGHNAANGFGGGMENQSMTAMGAAVFSTRAPRSSYSIVAHEAAHQWFGDAMSPYTWADLWLNEGFATYFAELWRADDVGSEPLGWRMEALRYTVLANGRNAPVGQPEQADHFGTNTYEKGGWVLHMLRQTVGETAFWAGIRQYFAQHRYGNVKTDDLRAAMEAASGKDLGTFFAQWVGRPGNPVVDVHWRQRGDMVETRMCQTGTPFHLTFNLAYHGQDQSVRSQLPVQLDSELTRGQDVPFTTTGVTPDPDFATLADFHVVKVEGELPGCASPAAAGRSEPTAYTRSHELRALTSPGGSGSSRPRLR